MTDGSGATHARYEYDPYGRQTKVAGDSDSDFGFTGHFAHAPSGLTMPVYRAYDAVAGRWISEDPAPGVVRRVGTSNPEAAVQASVVLLQAYGYADNNPTTFVDVLGMAASSTQQDCSTAAPVCFGNYAPCETYKGANAQCVCLCMGQDPWSNYVRCCLIRYKHLGSDTAHAFCFAVGRVFGGPLPLQKLADCIVRCLDAQRYCSPCR